MTESARLSRSPSRHWAAAAALLWVAACGTPAAPPRYHSLLPAPDAAPPLPPVAATPGWEPLSVAVPPQADRPEWVVRAADGALAVLDDERWTAPLAAEIGAAITERLRRATPATALPAGRKPWRVTIDILRFESLPQRLARVDAEWSLRPGDGQAAGWRCRGDFERAAGPGYLALAQAHREVMRQLGDAIASGLAAALGGASTPVCAAG